jgi:hypothetical protein
MYLLSYKHNYLPPLSRKMEEHITSTEQAREEKLAANTADL